MKIITISVNNLANPRYNYYELHGHNHQRFEEAEDLVKYLKDNLNPKRKYEIHLGIPDKERVKESELEGEIKKLFSKSTFILD